MIYVAGDVVTSFSPFGAGVGWFVVCHSSLITKAYFLKAHLLHQAEPPLHLGLGMKFRQAAATLACSWEEPFCFSSTSEKVRL